jgi:two-component system, OmpR family, alkaline phosphatase synthesis response regulator PhoP
MKTILLVEDSRMVRTILEKDLTRAGYRVITAADGEHGLQSAQQCRPDLVLLDMLLPKITGLDVLRTLKSDDATSALPIIALTGLSKGNADKLKKQGAAAFFEKSDQTLQGGSGELIELIERVITGSDHNSASRSAEK